MRLGSIQWFRIACFLTAALVIAPPSNPADRAPAKVFGGAQIQEIYRIRLDRDDGILESLTNIIQERGIQDGAVLTGIGSVQECTYHRIVSLGPTAKDEFIHVQGPMELVSLDGIIANGEPHLHLTLANAKGAFGGHIEKGCRVLYRVELTVAKFSGPALARKTNVDGTPLLQPK
jgi:uncharacterized protein